MSLPSSDAYNQLTQGIESSPAAALQSPYKVVDLFCGCGGLSTGFSLTRRFMTLAALDNNPWATETFSANSDDNPQTLTTDIRESKTRAQVLDALASRGVNGPGQLDCLIGGPPCEGFSQNRTAQGASPSRVTKFTDDPRNRLFTWFVEIAAELQPKVVLIENVPDLLRHRDGATARDIFDSLQQAGYRTVARVLNAADYGVPQLRRRAFFVGIRASDFSKTGLEFRFPQATHSSFPLGREHLDKDENWLPGDMGYWPSTWEALGDLPEAVTTKGASEKSVRYCEEPTESSALRRYYRQESNLPVRNHVARPLGVNSLRRVKEIDQLEAATLAERRRAREHYHYSYARLRWAEPARTITKFTYHVGSGMFCHPTFDRALTMREAARLQTFPDKFSFPDMPIRDMSSLIGGAVPPLLAQHLARQTVKYLDALTFEAMSAEERTILRPLKGDAVVRRLETGEWAGSPTTPPGLF